MGITGMKRLSETRYVGKVCEKHPELGGERLISTRGCVGCKRERWSKLNKARKETPTGIEYANRKRESQIKRRELEKDTVFQHYGKQCVVCGFDDERALTIDHKNQRGTDHRMPNGKRYTGPWLYRWLIKNGLPEGFRTLCANCQMIVFKEASK